MDTDLEPVARIGLVIIDGWLLIIRKLIKLRKFLMDDYSKKLGEMFGGMDYYS